MVAGERRSVEVYRRTVGDDDGSDEWMLHALGPGEQVELSSVGARFAVADVYADVEVV